MAPFTAMTIDLATERRVRAAAARFDQDPDDPDAVAASALRALARRQARAGKTCASCDERKPLSAFGADPQKADGLRTRCRSCRRRV